MSENPEPASTLPRPEWRTDGNGDTVCQHGTASDVHCCNCHSGFLFDHTRCVCGSTPDPVEPAPVAGRHAEDYGAGLAEERRQREPQATAAEPPFDPTRPPLPEWKDYEGEVTPHPLVAEVAALRAERDAARTALANLSGVIHDAGDVPVAGGDAGLVDAARTMLDQRDQARTALAEAQRTGFVAGCAAHWNGKAWMFDPACRVEGAIEEAYAAWLAAQPSTPEPQS